MRRSGKSKADQEWLKAFGAHVSELISKKGYASPYDFWINEGGEEMARATLNYIIAGKSDLKATTIRALAKLLGVPISKLFEF